MGISVVGSATVSTIVRTLKTCCSPVSRSNSIRMFWAADPKFFLYADSRAASIASMRTSLLRLFSSSNCLIALMSSVLFTHHSPPALRMPLRRPTPLTFGSALPLRASPRSRSGGRGGGRPGSPEVFTQIRHLHNELRLRDLLFRQADLPPVLQ